MKKILYFGLLFFSFAAFSFVYQDKQPLANLFQQARADYSFPGGCVAAGTANQVFVNNCYGYFTFEKSQKDTTTSLFDLASLTKVIATTSAVMKLYDQGKIHLDDPVIKYLPEFQGPSDEQTKLKARITIRDLLSHSSGLPPDSAATTWQELYQTPLITARHHEEIYSDINFLLLGKIVEKISGMTLNQYTQKAIFGPLGMRHTQFLLPENLRSKAVPGLYDCENHQYTQGIVSDPMAQKFGGDVGNAGLFSDINDLSIFAQMMLNQGVYQGQRIFKSSTVNLFTRLANLVPKSSRALGWDTVYNPAIKTQPQQFTAGQYINAAAYGHTGFAGTSIWVSKKYGIYVILLTNRNVDTQCNSKANNTNEKYWRQVINNAVWQNLGFTRKNSLAAEPKNSIS